MRIRTYILVVGSILPAGCGVEESGPGAELVDEQVDAARVLGGVRWIDERGQSMADPGFSPRAGQVSVVVFFEPGSERSRLALKALAQAQREHPEFDLYGATPSTDEAPLVELRADTGATFPVLLGVSPGTREAWGVQELPAVRAISADGRLVARSMMGVLARLEAPAR